MIAEGDCRQDCTVIQMGPDPLFSRYPVRAAICADINLAGETDEVFSLLEEALRPLQAARQQHVAERAAYTQNRIQQQKNRRDALPPCQPDRGHYQTLAQLLPRPSG